jgi:hypothetical protein
VETRYKTVLFDSIGHNSVSSPFPESRAGIKIINHIKHKKIKIKKQEKEDLCLLYFGGFYGESSCQKHAPPRQICALPAFSPQNRCTHYCAIFRLEILK